MARAQKQTVTETALIAKVVEFLNGNGFVCWRQQNTGHFNALAATQSVFQYAVHNAALLDSFRRQGGVSTLLKSGFRTCLDRSWRKVPNAQKGVADIIGWHKATGKMVAAEIKIGSDTLSSEQDAWLKSLKSAGGIVFLVRDFETFKSFFQHGNWTLV